MCYVSYVCVEQSTWHSLLSSGISCIFLLAMRLHHVSFHWLVYLNELWVLLAI